MASFRKVLKDWCTQRTSGYRGVSIAELDDLDSWKDGLAFCALLHSYRPELIQFDSLSKSSPERNLKQAFDAGERLGIPKMIEPSDLLENRNFDRSDIIAYLSSVYRRLEKGEKLDEASSLKKESEQAKEKLKNVQNELVNLQAKLNEAREAMKQKEVAKRRLERQVEQLKIQHSSEKKTNAELEKEHNDKIKKLEERIANASGGAKAQLLQQLREEREKKDLLQQKQKDLEREVSDIKQQLKDEEKKAKQLERDKKKGRRKEEFG